MMYDIRGVGLNLHEACSRVCTASITRSFALEEQLENAPYQLQRAVTSDGDICVGN